MFNHLNFHSLRSYFLFQYLTLAYKLLIVTSCEYIKAFEFCSLWQRLYTHALKRKISVIRLAAQIRVVHAMFIFG